MYESHNKYVRVYSFNDYATKYSSKLNFPKIAFRNSLKNVAFSARAGDATPNWKRMVVEALLHPT